MPVEARPVNMGPPCSQAIIRVKSRRTHRASALRGGPRDAETAQRARAPTLSASGIVESQLSPSGEPVLGLYLHVAYMMTMGTFEQMVGQREISPSVIGVVAHLAHQPGMSQAELARLIGLERATIGLHVARAVG